MGGHPPEPRPGLDPGPLRPTLARPTHEVPGQARDATPLSRRLRYSAALMTLLLATPASAQIIPTGTPAADILLSKAIAEQRVLHTCSAFDAVAHRSIVDLWAMDVNLATEILAANAVPPEAIAAFTAAAAPEALMPAPETPFEDVKQLCDSHPDWQGRIARFDVIILANDLPKAFQ